MKSGRILRKRGRFLNNREDFIQKRETPAQIGRLGMYVPVADLELRLKLWWSVKVVKI